MGKSQKVKVTADKNNQTQSKYHNTSSDIVSA